MTDGIHTLPRLPQAPVNLAAAAAVVEAEVQAELVRSYVALVQSAREAVETLRYTMLNGRYEESRVAAAKEILDRAGIVPEVKVNIQTADMDRESRIDELVRKMATMRTGLSTAITPTPPPIEAEATG